MKNQALAIQSVEIKKLDEKVTQELGFLDGFRNNICFSTGVLDRCNLYHILFLL